VRARGREAILTSNESDQFDLFVPSAELALGADAARACLQGDVQLQDPVRCGE